MKKKEIAILTPDFNIGGVSKVLGNLLDFIDYDKYSVTLCLSSQEDRNDGFNALINDNVVVKHYNNVFLSDLTEISDIVKNYIKENRYLKAFEAFFSRCLSRIFVKNDIINKKLYARSLPSPTDKVYDVAISYNSTYLGYTFDCTNVLKAKKSAVFVHASVRQRNDELCKLLKSYDKIYCVSSGCLESFNKTYPELSNKTEVFLNLQKTDEIKEKAKEQIEPEFLNDDYILSVGRLAEQKAFETAPKISRMLLDSGYDIKWYIIGEGSTRKAIEDEIKKYKVENNVFLLGERFNPYPYMKHCLLYVQTSLYEGLCTTTLEAKILQKPVVTTNVAGASDQFDNYENGIITEDLSPENVYKAIKYLLDNPKVREKFSERNENTSGNEEELNKLYDFI